MVDCGNSLCGNWRGTFHYAAWPAFLSILQLRLQSLGRLFVVGIGISLFMGAIFFPLFYLGGEERNEVFLIISLLCGIGIVMWLSTLINTLFPKMTAPQLICGGIAILACSLLVYVLSYPLTVSIFKKKEY